MPIDSDSLHWIPCLVLTNIQTQERIGNEVISLAPADDPEIVKLRKTHQEFDEFLSRFTDAFGVAINPSVIIVRDGSPKLFFQVDAIASFRDLIAASVIPLQRALEIARPRGHRIYYSDLFAVYPWMIDKSFEDIYAITPAISAVHDISKFRGQSDPNVSSMILSQSHIDTPLFDALLERWIFRYGNPEPGWKYIAIFRSLNMANSAMQMPANSYTTFHDYGRILALWVSAFEILGHPGIGKSGWKQIFDLLTNIDWHSSNIRNRWYKSLKNSKQVNLACWLYGKIYKSRNDFFHGNPVTQSSLFIEHTDISLFQFAAPLYRMAMTGLIPLNWDHPIPPIDPPEPFGKYIADYIEFTQPQKHIEDALVVARGGKKR